MNGYLLGVIGTVLIASLVIAIAPEGKTSALVKGFARLGCVLVIISPVVKFFVLDKEEIIYEKFFLESGIQSNESFIQYYSEWRVREAEQRLQVELSEKFDVSATVALTWAQAKDGFGKYEADIIKIEKISVDVPNDTREEIKKDMQDYVKKNYCSEVYIE